MLLHIALFCLFFFLGYKHGRQVERKEYPVQQLGLCGNLTESEVIKESMERAKERSENAWKRK